MAYRIKEFKNGIFALRTRRFGTLAEIMVKKLYGFTFSKCKEYDLKDNDSRIEVKFSTVRKNNDKPIKEENIISECINAKANQRMLQSDEIETNIFDCNIQQVKCDNFDVLYYGLFFADKIEIFRILSKYIKEDKCIKYSDKQHSKSVGEGQFHINNDTYGHHKHWHFLKAMSYNELYKLFKQKR